MDSTILEAGELRERILEGLRPRIAELKKKGLKPRLDIVSIGHNPESEVYMNGKKKAGEGLGIQINLHRFTGKESRERIEEELRKLNSVKGNGIIIQLPIAEGHDINELLQLIDPARDVDGITPSNLGRICSGNPLHQPCTPLGIIELIKHFGISPQGKVVCIVNRSLIVGKPLIQMMLNENATVIACHSRTHDVKHMTRQSDIVVAAIGRPKHFTREFFRSDAVVIDVGINRTEQGLWGDVDFEGVKGHVKAITPVPGGVGKMTVAMLMSNVVRACELQG